MDQRKANFVRVNDLPLTRRRLLLGLGGTIAGTMFGSRMTHGEGQVSPVMARLSAYMSEARNLAPPADVVEKAKHHILDTFAAMISGAELPPSRCLSTSPRLAGRQHQRTRSSH